MERFSFGGQEITSNIEVMDERVEVMHIRLDVSRTLGDVMGRFYGNMNISAIHSLFLSYTFESAGRRFSLAVHFTFSSLTL